LAVAENIVAWAPGLVLTHKYVFEVAVVLRGWLGFYVANGKGVTIKH
jgi:hypothetical protein